MNILRISSDLFPFVMGGMPIHVHLLSNFQELTKNNVTVMTSTNLPNDLKKINNIEFLYKIVNNKVIVSPLDNKISFELLLNLNHLINEFDIVHAHSHLFFSTNIASFFKNFSKKPLIITNHGLYSQTANLTFQKLYMRSIGLYTLKKADKIINYSKFEAEKLIKFGIPKEKLAVIPNGIVIDQFTTNEMVNYEEIKLLWIGRLKPGKGVETLIKTLFLLKRKAIKFKINIIGEGPLKTKLLKKIVEYKLENFANLIDKVNYDKINEFYIQSNLLLITSENEGVPRILLEALCTNTPVICNRIEHLFLEFNEMIEFYDYNNVEDLTNRIIKFQNNPEYLIRKTEKASLVIKKDYNWKFIVEKTNKLFLDLIEKN